MKTIDREQKYYERIRSSFIGQKIKEVYYLELDYDSDTEFWKTSDEFHSVDMAIVFKLNNNRLLQVKWDSEFHCYGIGFERLSEITKKEGLKTSNVSNNYNWKKIINKKITAIKILWDTNEDLTVMHPKNKLPKKENNPIKIPLTWEISFYDVKIWISALEIDNEKRPNFWADHLSVLFTNREQEKYQLIKNASLEYNILHD